MKKFKSGIKVYVYLWDNDPIQQEYKVGIYDVKGYIIPYNLYEDVINEARNHHVYFSCSDIIDAFVKALLYDFGQAVSTNCNMFLNVEALYVD